jgi:hypothetical protein
MLEAGFVRTRTRVPSTYGSVAVGLEKYCRFELREVGRLQISAYCLFKLVSCLPYSSALKKEIKFLSETIDYSPVYALVYTIVTGHCSFCVVCVVMTGTMKTEEEQFPSNDGLTPDDCHSRNIHVECDAM